MPRSRRWRTPSAPERVSEVSKAVIGLGANVGDRLANIRKAILLAGERAGTLVARSDVYESPPWGVADQPRFLNACAILETDLPPYDLMSELKEIEFDLGRVKRARWGPREIDLDLLLYDDLCCDDSFLTVPHPRLHERAFVLVPLAAIAPDWVHPVLKASAVQLASGLTKAESNGIVRIVDL